MKPQRRASFNSISVSATQPWYENKTQNPNLYCSNQQKNALSHFLPPQKEPSEFFQTQLVNVINFSKEGCESQRFFRAGQHGGDT